VRYFHTGQVSDVVKQLTAGNDLLMPGLQSQQESILKKYYGTLSQGDVATNLSRILELVLKSPAMNNYKYSNKPNLKENAQITRQAAAEGTILLKTTITHYLIHQRNATCCFCVTSYNFISEEQGAVMLMKLYYFTAGWINQLGYQIDNELKEIYLPFMSSQKKLKIKDEKKDYWLLPNDFRI
jgi:beta-glucosidase